MPHPSNSRQANYRRRTAGQIKRFSTYIPAQVLDQARHQSLSVGVSFPAYLLAALHQFHASPLSKDGEQILQLARELGAPHDYTPHQAHKKNGAN